MFKSLKNQQDFHPKNPVQAARRGNELMTADRHERLIAARQAAGFKSARSAALRFGWTLSTYASHENGQTPLPVRAAHDYAKAFKCSQSWLLTGEGKMNNGNGGEVINLPALPTAPVEPPPIEEESDCLEPIEVEKLDGEVARELSAARRNHPKAEIWRMASDALAGLGFMPGDYLIVDLRRPVAGDKVIFEIAGRMHVRLYYPPYLFALPINRSLKPIVVDGNIKLRGTVVSKITLVG